MDTLVVVPGIMGSDLWLGKEQLWPPRIGHLMKVVDPGRLLSADVVTRDIIREVLWLDLYDELLKPLRAWGYREGTPSPNDKGRVVVFPYNWVRDIRDTAQELSARLGQLADEDPGGTLVLLAHSMGGLVCTYALECLVGGGLAWRNHVRLFVTFGTPFYGAPEALLNAFGVEGTTGIPAADCRLLMADPRFPSAYQLFPHLVAKSNWNAAAPLDPVDDYQLLDGLVPLGVANLAGALALQHELANAVANPRTRKFNFCGATKKTVWAMGQAPYPGASVVPEIAPAGDGTVPSWSGRQGIHVQFAPLGAKHKATFKDPDLLRILEQLLLLGNAPTGPQGPKGTAMKPSPPPPSPQPSISLTRNTLSSLRDTVEVEVAEPPVDDTLQLAWIPVTEVETARDLARHLSEKRGKLLEPVATIALGGQLEYPQHLTLARPDAPGLYALTAWGGQRQRFIGELDSARMDLLWVFQDADTGKSGDHTPYGKPLTVDDAMELTSPHEQLHHMEG